MYNCYNVIPFYTGASGPLKDTMMRLINSLTEAFNRKEKLPRYIFFVIDKDIVEAVMSDDDYKITDAIEMAFRWLARQCERFISARRENLVNERRGAVVFEPKICWFKMLQRPFISVTCKEVSRSSFDSTRRYSDKMNKIIATRRKNNNAIDELAAKFNHLVFEATNINVHQDFDNLGKLSFQGIKQMWKNFDNQQKAFELRKINWKPRMKLPQPPNFSMQVQDNKKKSKFHK